MVLRIVLLEHRCDLVTRVVCPEVLVDGPGTTRTLHSEDVAQEVLLLWCGVDVHPEIRDEHEPSLHTAFARRIGVLFTLGSEHRRELGSPVLAVWILELDTS